MIRVHFALLYARYNRVCTLVIGITLYNREHGSWLQNYIRAVFVAAHVP